MFVAVVAFVDNKYVTSHTKPYKMCYMDVILVGFFSFHEALQKFRNSGGLILNPKYYSKVKLRYEGLVLVLAP